MAKPAHNYNDKLQDRKVLVEWFKQGCAAKEDLVIGAEHEKIIFYKDDYAIVPYEGKDGKPGIKDLLEHLRDHHDWTPFYEDDNLIRLEKNGASVTLEPGGQIELSGAALHNLHEVANETKNHFSELLEACEANGMDVLGLGYHPTMTLDDAPLMPMSRFQTFYNFYKSNHFETARKLMVATSSTQVNLGYSSEDDMVKKLRVGLSLQPIASAIFANSPFEDGKLSDSASTRSRITHNAADGRYGFMMPVAFEDDFGFERYTDFILNEMPVFGIYHNDHFMWIEKPVSFMDCVNGPIPGLEEQHDMTLNDWFNHINTIWPEVRMRQWLEMRGCDVGSSEDMINALPAFWVGLLYDDEALDKAYDLIKDWTAEDREFLRTRTPEDGLQTPFKGGTVQDIAKKLVELAELGLRNRNIQNEDGVHEGVYLKPLRDIVDTGLTQSDVMKKKYENEWDKDISHVFNEFSFGAHQRKQAREIMAGSDRAATSKTCPGADRKDWKKAAEKRADNENKQTPPRRPPQSGARTGK